MNIGIIGAGRMGSSIALALAEKGNTITGISSRSKESSDKLNALLGLTLPNDAALTVGNSDVVFIAVHDGAIEETTMRIARENLPYDITKKVFLHTSGALTSELLKPLEERGGHIGSLHPIQTFADKETGWKGLFNIYFGFEGSQKARECAEKIVESLHGTLLFIERDMKPLYHAAACIISNYTVALSYAAGKLLERAGIPEIDATRALIPLLLKTADNINELGSLSALTGPVSRGDFVTVSRHMETLLANKTGMDDLYRVLGRLTIKASLERGGYDDNTAKKLEEILEC
ncbi:MAG TPA: Rossmann-like and DUF2520 domain-containing protein [Clostridia bacterium]